MVCKSLLLPLVAGLALCANNASARGNGLKQENLASTSLSFIENKGQIINQFQQPRPDIDFRLSAGNGLNVFIGDGAIHYQWASSMDNGHSLIDNGQLTMDNEKGEMKDAESGRNMPGRKVGYGLGASGESMDASPVFRMYRMDVELIGANKNAAVITEGKQQFHERYFQPWINKSNSNEGVVAYSYEKITYRNVYPNIDWVLYVKDNLVEYDFVVRPGGSVSDIQLKYGGATKLGINADGNLRAKTPMGEITERAPYSFDASGKAVASRFVLNGDILSFSTGDYSGVLTIDPTLEWGTYFGGLGSDISYGMANDQESNIYMAGITGSVSNIATTGSYQTTYGGGGSSTGDAFLAKFNAGGDCLWATYYGGSGNDRGAAVAVDPLSGQVYLAGNTQSVGDIASSGAFQDTLGGAYDVFLAKFDTSGQRIWATYYGGSGTEGSNAFNTDVACDKTGQVYLAGDCTSTAGIATANGYQTINGGSKDAFIVQFDSSGERQWGTYFGGEGNDYGRKISCDSAGNIYLTGYTNSSTGIATTSAYQSSEAGSYDGFLAKFSSAGSLQWATYFGGQYLEQLSALQADQAGDVYIGGITSSTSGIASAGSYQAVQGGSMDCFLAQFDSSGSLNWATYYGGSNAESIGSLITSDNNDVFIAGSTKSIDNIAVPGTYQDTLNGGYDGFVVKFNSSGQRQWATYYGGSSNEFLNSISLNSMQDLYFTGQTNSAIGISVGNVFQQNFGGGDNDALLVKFNVCETPEEPTAIVGDTVLCSGHPYTFSTDTVPGALSYNWALPAGWNGNSDSNSITITPDAGSGRIAVAANNACATSDSLSLNITVNASPEPVIINNNNTLTTTQPYSSYQWNKDGQAINGATAASYTVTANGDYSVSVTNDNACSGTSDTLILSGVGIDELQGLAKVIAIYPNPTADVVHVQSPVAVDVKMMSIEGRILFAVKDAKEISLKDFAAGMYWLRIYDKEGRLVKVGKVVRK